jgi:hypothetical protein
MDQATITSQIRVAFPAAPIVFEGATTGGMDDGEYKRHVDGRSWLELDRAYIARRSDALSFLDPHHVAAVLPAYLTLLVTEGTSTPVPDTLVLVLDEHDSRVEALRALLSPGQRAAVADSLRYFATTVTGRMMDAASTAGTSWSNDRKVHS